jgi:predicted DCC family thiol-disulfide oxidoreductase YuxK
MSHVTYVRDGPGTMKQHGRLMVFMDGECALCRVTSNVLDRTDRAGAAEVLDFRADTRYQDHGITEAAATARIQVIDTTTGNIYEGFDAIRAIAREVPLLWPLRPLLAFLASLRLGDPLYDFIATYRPRRPRPTGTFSTKG